MKNRIILTTILAFSMISCKAQIIAVEDFNNYNKDLEDGAYIKDVNNVLAKFVGVWKGTYQSKNFEFRIVKSTRSFLNIKKDGLLMRYKITDSNGTVIEDVLSLPNDNVHVMKNGYVSKYGLYVFSYIGVNFNCGQNGWVFAEVYGINKNKMQLSFSS